MKQEKIKYREIMDLGFEEEVDSDNVYFDEFGYDYCIITKNLTKKIYLDWKKETQLCKLVRTDKTHNIKAEMPIKNIEHLKEIIDFFCNDNGENFVVFPA